MKMSITEITQWTVEAVAEFQKKIKEWVLAVMPTKVSDLENDADYAERSAIKTKTSQLENDAGFITSAGVPTAYVKDASVSDDGKTLSLTKNGSETPITFQGGSSDVFDSEVMSGDGSSQSPYSVKGMQAATATASGKKGLVPAPAMGDQDKVLTGAGTWVPQKNYTPGENIDIDANGVVSVKDKKDLAVDTDTMSVTVQEGAVVLGVKPNTFVKSSFVQEIVQCSPETLPSESERVDGVWYVVVKEPEVAMLSMGGDDEPAAGVGEAGGES